MTRSISIGILIVTLIAAPALSEGYKQRGVERGKFLEAEYGGDYAMVLVGGHMAVAQECASEGLVSEAEAHESYEVLYEARRYLTDQGYDKYWEKHDRGWDIGMDIMLNGGATSIRQTCDAMAAHGKAG